MKTNILRLFALLFLVLVACQKEQEVPLGKIVLDKVVFHENANQVGQYLYNKNGSVQRYEYYFDNKLVEYVDYLYSGTRLTSKQYYEVNSNNSFQLASTDVYAYGQNGNLHQVTRSKNNIPELIYTFSWQNNRVNGIDIQNNHLGNTTTSYLKFEYDQNNNATKVKSFGLVGNAPDLNYVIELTFDSNPNPYLGIVAPYEYLLNNTNNIMKSEQKSQPGQTPYASTNSTYIYNEAGLPQEQLTTMSLYGQVSELKTKFYYREI